MSQSIGSKLSSLKYKGLITDTEYDRLKKALNSLEVDEMYQLEMENAEEFIAKSVIEDIKAEIELQKKGFPPSSDYYKAITRAVNIIDTHISALNNDQFERIWQNTVEEMKRRKICEDILEEAEEYDSETMSGSLLTDDDLRLLINDAIKKKKAMVCVNEESVRTKSGTDTEMTREEFIELFGITPEKAKEILERFRELVNQYVHETIKHADYYIDPFNYCDKDYLEHHLGVPIEKPEDDDGYTCLFEYGREHGAVETFKDLISWHTTHGGHTSAIRACELMGLEWERDL